MWKLWSSCTMLTICQRSMAGVLPGPSGTQTVGVSGLKGAMPRKVPGTGTPFSSSSS